MKKSYLLMATAICVASMFLLQSCNEKAIMVVYDDPTEDIGSGNEDPEPEATLSFSEDIVTLNGTAQVANVIAITNVKKVEASSDQGWCVASVSGKMIQLAVVSNDGETDMSATITVTASALDNPENKITKTFTLVQSAKASDISFASLTHTVYGRAGEWKFDFTANVTQVTATVLTGSAWCQAAIQGSQLVVTTTENPAPSTRTATINVTAGSGSNTMTVTVTINQQDVALDPKEWAVGDLVEISPTEKGILFWVSPDMETGQIMSLDVAVKIWAKQSLGVTGASANETENITLSNASRVANHASVHTAWDNLAAKTTFAEDFPAFAHCESKGTGWYLPSVIDCRTFLVVIDKKASEDAAFKTKMTNAGCTVIDTAPQTGFTSYTYTNSENSDVQARVVDIRITNVAFTGVTGQNKHGSGRAVRCVKEVALQGL